MAKAMGNGFPVGAVWARTDVAAATAALNKYFDPASRRTQNAATMLQQMQTHLKAAELPRLDETFAALTTAAAGR